MFKQILFTQWKWAAWIVVFAAIAGFGVPIMSVQPATSGDAWRAGQILNEVGAYGWAYPMLAAIVGLVLGLSAWSADQRLRHVYALSLPVPRWYYVLLRFGAGAVLLIPVIAGIWIGGLVATASVTLPSGLHAYPSALALRFALAALISYAGFFAVGSGTQRTAGYVLAGIGGLIVVQVLVASLGSNLNLIGWVFDSVLIWPGPLAVFSGKWMLINV